MMFSGSRSFIAYFFFIIIILKSKHSVLWGNDAFKEKKKIITVRVRNAAGVLLEFPRLDPFTLLCVCVCVCVCTRALSHVRLCDPMNCRPPGSFVPGIFPILEWVAISYSRGPSCRRDQACVSYVSCIGRWVLYHLHHLGSPSLCLMPQTKLRHHFLFGNDGTTLSALRHGLAAPPNINILC